MLNLHDLSSPLAILSLVVFVVAYIFVMAEEFIELRKSKPMILAAGIIWIFVAILALNKNMSAQAEAALRHYILEYAELFLFLLVAMTYVNALAERNVFEVLRCWLLERKFSFRKLFWITGFLAFFISPFADNLTTALIMCAVVIAVGGDNKKFISIACVNIVVAANAGGAFSPFGDITTLMVWQKGVIPFVDFFQIFLPSLINFVIPAIIMTFFIPKVQPNAQTSGASLKLGANFMVILFLLTIVTAVCFHQFLHLPPAVGMMMGLSYLMFYSYYIKLVDSKHGTPVAERFNFFRKVEGVEWDALLFFYGIIICVGGLSVLGYLSWLSNFLYLDVGKDMGLSAINYATPANIFMGVFAAIVGNIPVMFAVLSMNPNMSEGQWLLITYTAGAGGSLLSIGSAAGIALMGQTKGIYSFFGHLKWIWAIAIGYALGIVAHFWINYDLFSKSL
jgi:Na+/H+ antiporter NhaD/arsenite permease-like protein